MNLDKYVKYVRRRIKKGANLDEVLSELSSHLSDRQLDLIVQRIADQDFRRHIFKKKHPLAGRNVKLILILALATLAAVSWLIYSQDLTFGKRWQFFDVSMIKDPVQEEYHTNETIYIDFEGYEFDVSPVATYEVSALVGGKRYYNDDDKYAPVDLMLLWGDIAVPEFDQFLMIAQKDRFGNWRCNPPCPYTAIYINSHCANTHIIPANADIERGLRNVRVKDMIQMEGYLVNVVGRYKGMTHSRKTSLTRTDTGKGSDEIFYVKSLTLNNITYS